MCDLHECGVRNYFVARYCYNFRNKLLLCTKVIILWRVRNFKFMRNVEQKVLLIYLE